MTPAPARSHRRIHGRSHAPQAPRRVSGPVQRRLVPAPAGPVGFPRRGTTGFFARVRAHPAPRLIDRQLRPEPLRHGDVRFEDALEFMEWVSEDHPHRFTVDGDEVVVIA